MLSSVLQANLGFKSWKPESIASTKSPHTYTPSRLGYLGYRASFSIKLLSLLQFVKYKPTLSFTQLCVFTKRQERKCYVLGLTAAFTINDRGTEINERSPQKTICSVYFDQFVKVIDHSSHGRFEVCKHLDY